MIDAVKTTLANSSLQKQSLEQTSTLTSYSADPERLQAVAQAPYVSPTVRIDNNAKIAIMEFKESETGEVVLQVPSEQQLRAYKAREAREDAKLRAQLDNAGKSSSDDNTETSVAPPKTQTQPSAPIQSSDINTSAPLSSTEELKILVETT